MFRLKIATMSTNDYIDSIINKSKYRTIFDSINYVLFNAKVGNRLTDTVKNAIYCATDKEIDADNCFVIEYEFIKNKKINMMFIFDRNSAKLKKDQFIFDDKLTTAFILPHDFASDDFNHQHRINIVRSIYNTIFDIVKFDVSCATNSSLYKNLSMAPIILTIHTIDTNYSGTISEMFQDSKKISIDVIKEIRDCEDPIDLLDLYLAASYY